jgi:hypothetical protein
MFEAKLICFSSVYRDGKSPLERAVEMNHDKIVAELKRAGATK